jgi:hypothetical protein
MHVPEKSRYRQCHLYWASVRKIMSETSTPWRSALFRCARAFVLIDIVLYIAGVTLVSVLGTADAKMRAGAWLFIFGTAFSLLTFILSLFGSGSKRIGLALASIAALPFWFGLTLY